jgi:hypothetical protein
LEIVAREQTDVRLRDRVRAAEVEN